MAVAWRRMGRVPAEARDVARERTRESEASIVVNLFNAKLMMELLLCLNTANECQGKPDITPFIQAQLTAYSSCTTAMTPHV